jgi:hypothetical protein
MSTPHDPPTYGAPAYGSPGSGPPGWEQPGWEQPGWEDQAYGQPAYAPPGYGGYPPYYRRPTNTLAILSLVFAFVFAPAGLVMGIIARKQIQRTGEEGSGLALAGAIVGGVFTAIWVFVIVLWIVALIALGNGSFGP